MCVNPVSDNTLGLPAAHMTHGSHVPSHIRYNRAKSDDAVVCSRFEVLTIHYKKFPLRGKSVLSDLFWSGGASDLV